ncbi:MAG: glycosyltransferase [Rhizobacter sp.]|nr:glycosyltransferase [Chlorobiales bacterium]
MPPFVPSVSPAFVALALLLAVSGTVYCGFILRITFGIGLEPARSKALQPSGLTVAVVIAACNEAANIAACLDSLTRQRRAPDEIILIDDASEDATVAIAEGFESSLPTQLRIVRLPVPSGKKAAIAAGIAVAQSEIIACTDADCTVPETWISEITTSFAGAGVGVVSMPVFYREDCEGQTLFEKTEALEFLSLIGVGASLVWSGTPAICNGANLAYLKSAWQQAGGFAASRFTSGDDEHVMRQIFRAGYKVIFNASPEAAVTTPGTGNLKAFLKQRIRWASKGTGYREISLGFVLTLALLYVFNLVVLLSPLWMWFGDAWILAAGFAVAVKCSVDFFSMRRIAVRFGKAKWMRYFFFAELLQLLYVSVCAPAAQLARISGGYTWKGRRIWQ